MNAVDRGLPAAVFSAVEIVTREGCPTGSPLCLCSLIRLVGLLFGGALAACLELACLGFVLGPSLGNLLRLPFRVTENGVMVLVPAAVARRHLIGALPVSQIVSANERFNTAAISSRDHDPVGFITEKLGRTSSALVLCLRLGFSLLGRPRLAAIATAFVIPRVSRSRPKML